MLDTVSTFGSTQAARLASMPGQLIAPVPGREALLESFRQRNSVFDVLFYDVGVVSHAEAVAIAPHLAAEGAILLVPPSGAGALRLCRSIPEFTAVGGHEIATLAVAGVGSSALGAAAFARNIADALGEPVAAVVSGYGLADLATEALGGYFWFGALNGLRHMFEMVDDATHPTTVRSTKPFQSRNVDVLARSSEDTRTVIALLEDPRFAFTTLVGHSKGNLVISEALYDLRRADPDRLAVIAGSAAIVTVSARIAMPPQFTRVIDIVGAWDWFGALNSRPDIPADVVVPKAWHHTTTELPAHR